MEGTETKLRRSLKTHFDAVVHFFTTLDSEMISDLLDDKLTYQDFPKHIFIRKIGDLFHDLKLLGDTRLIAMVDDDPLPVGGNFGVSFEGNHSCLFMDIVFEVDEIGYITDIYELTDVDTEDSVHSVRQRVFIDNFMASSYSMGIDDDDDPIAGSGKDDDMML